MIAKRKLDGAVDESSAVWEICKSATLPVKNLETYT